MTHTMTRKIAGTKPEQDLHTWSKEKAKIHPKKADLTLSLTRSLTRSSDSFFHSAKMLSAYGKHFQKNSFDLIFTLFLTNVKINLTTFINLSVMGLTVCEL